MSQAGVSLVVQAALAATGLAGLVASLAAGSPGPRAHAARRPATRRQLVVAILPSLMAGAAVGLVAWLILGLPLPALTLAALGVLMERAAAGWRRASARARIRDQLVAAVDLLAQLLPAGHGVRQSLQVLAESGPVDLRPELERVMARLQQVSLEQALVEADSRMRQPLFTLIATTLIVGGRSGGRIAPLLDELARAAHQIQAAEDQVRAEQAQGRLGALVIALMPLLLIVVLRVVNPAYLEPYHSLGGQLVLAFLLALIVLGYLWMTRILRLTDLDQIVVRGDGAVEPAPETMASLELMAVRRTP
jgi:Flp pilus assembly protein TadB